MSKLYLILSTWFYAGYFPKMPGTMGSLAAFPLIYGLYSIGSMPLFVASIIILYIVGWFCSKQTLIDLNLIHQDPSFIVIDEVVGQMIPILVCFDAPKWWPLAFVLFRVFDIWKPWPVSWADNLHGTFSMDAVGIMLDDVLAGIYALIVLLLIRQFS